MTGGWFARRRLRPRTYLFLVVCSYWPLSSMGKLSRKLVVKRSKARQQDRYLRAKFEGVGMRGRQDGFVLGVVVRVLWVADMGDMGERANLSHTAAVLLLCCGLAIVHLTRISLVDRCGSLPLPSSLGEGCFFRRWPSCGWGRCWVANSGNHIF